MRKLIGSVILLFTVFSCKTINNASYLNSIYDYLENDGDVVLRVRSDILTLPVYPKIDDVTGGVNEPLNYASRLFSYQGNTRVGYRAKIGKIGFSLHDNPNYIQLGIEVPVDVDLTYSTSLNAGALRYAASPTVSDLKSKITSKFGGFALIGVNHRNQLSRSQATGDSFMYQAEVSQMLQTQDGSFLSTIASENNQGTQTVQVGPITSQRRVLLPNSRVARGLRRFGRRLLRVPEASVRRVSQNGRVYIEGRPAVLGGLKQAVANRQAVKKDAEIEKQIADMYEQNKPRIKKELYDLGSKEFESKLDTGITYVLQEIDNYFFKDLSSFFAGKKFFTSSRSDYIQLAIGGSKPVYDPSDNLGSAMELLVNERYLNELVGVVVPPNSPVNLELLADNLSKLPMGIDLSVIKSQSKEIQKQLDMLEKDGVYNLRFATKPLELDFRGPQSIDIGLNLLAEYKPSGTNASVIKNDRLKISVSIGLVLETVRFSDGSLQLALVLASERPVQIRTLEEVIPSSLAGSSKIATAFNIGLNSVSSFFSEGETPASASSIQSDDSRRVTQDFIDAEVQKTIANKEAEISTLIGGGLTSMRGGNAGLEFALPEFSLHSWGAPYAYKPYLFEIAGNNIRVAWKVFDVKGGRVFSPGFAVTDANLGLTNVTNGSVSRNPRTSSLGSCVCKLVDGDVCTLQRSQSGSDYSRIVKAEKLVRGISSYRWSSNDSYESVCTAQACFHMVSDPVTQESCR